MKLWHWLCGEPDGIYVQQIQALKTDKPLPLPAIKSLRATHHQKAKKDNVLKLREAKR